jgi:predicted ATPase
LDKSQTDPNEFPWNLPAVSSLVRLEFTTPITFFIGENGSGKSTLTEAIAVAAGLNAEGGTRNLRFQERPTESDLDKRLTLAWDTLPRSAFFLRAETFFNMASAYEQAGSPDRPDPMIELHSESHGQQFLTAVRERFGPGGLFLMDEPESALSFTSQLALLRVMHEYSRSGSQFIVATHSPVLLAFPEATIWHLDAQGMRTVTWEDAPPVTDIRAFLADPGLYLHHLFSDD